MLTEKAIAICLLEVLNEYSDEKHILILTTSGKNSLDNMIFLL